MKLYYKEIYVGSYNIQAVADTPENCIKAILSEYRKQFGPPTENGFESVKEWKEYHDLYTESVQEITLNKAWMS